MDGRSSLFDPAEIDALQRGRLARREGELRTMIATRVTRVDDHALLLRGEPLVDLVTAGISFRGLVDRLWESPDSDVWPDPESDLRTTIDGLDGLRVLVAKASAADPLRHDLSDHSVRAAGRRMILAMATGLTPRRPGSDKEIEAAVCRRLTSRRCTVAERAAIDTAVALLIDHGLASSTFAARIAASVRADPYSVVSAGLGVLGGPLHGAASAAVHDLIAAAARHDDAARAVGEAVRDSDRVPGFGHTIYTVQDPRYSVLMAAIIEAWAEDPRLAHVYRVRDVVAERRADLPNVDLALGALTWLAGMQPQAGETIFAIARSAGWLAHAMEEYGEQPVRFRPRARYLG